MVAAPLLSIGMIFKNEERCIERCLKSLEPLRKAIPCELIMADTGATDGSREIAERYADQVFDFPWINDFAAARNAVMDRCRGSWYFSVDCDEWLDVDISELIAFLTGKAKVNYGFVIQRNYRSPELEKSNAYNDFFALRLLRMATGQRYIGMIHESWIYTEPLARLGKTVLHHDGYIPSSMEGAQNKKQRNMILLRKTLKSKPEDLRILLLCIESGSGDADLVQYVRTAVGLVQRKCGQWRRYGACIMRHAVEIARIREMQEFEQWIEYAQQEFPDSIFTLVDLQVSAFQAACDKKDWARAIRCGETYQRGMRRLRPGHLSKKTEEELSSDPLNKGNEAAARTMQTGLANAYFENGQGEKALETLADLDGSVLSPDQVRNAVVVLCGLHARTLLEIAPTLTTFYDQISKKEPDEQKQKARLAAFDAIAATAFTKAYQKEEQQKNDHRRPAYTAFRCLAEQCETGRAAALMMAIEPEEIRAWLAKVENWQALPIEALEYALREEVAFPLCEKPLPVEVMDGLAARLTQGENMARQLALALADDQEYPDLQSLFWAQSLVLAALQTFDWSLEKNDAPVSKFACLGKKKGLDERPRDTPEIGLALIRRFALIEAALLPIQYTPQALTEENAALLPPMHRWGLCCALAFEALDGGKPQEYLAILRRGLAACPGQKETVQFLLDRFMEDARPQAGPEMLALAEKVKNILAVYDPADPAVAAIRQSPAYKQVAWLIEEANTGGRPVPQERPKGVFGRRGRCAGPVRAVFFAELGEKWDAMQSVYEFMRDDPRFDPVVVRSPVFRVVERDGKREQETLYTDFLTPMGIPSLGYDEYDLAADCPELAFISQPYESCTLPQFWPGNIAKHTRLVYLPYFLPDKVEDTFVTTLAQMPVYQCAWKVVCSGKKHYAFYSRYAENRGANALVTGLPKTDPLVALNENPPFLPDGWERLQGKTVFLWNSWYDIAFSSLRYFDELMNWFEAHKDCALIWRPHPLSDLVTKISHPDLYLTWRERLQRAEAAENILLDKEASYLAAFGASRAMISDYSSMLPQYLLLDKPALWIRGRGFRFTGEEFIDSRWMEQAARAEDILAFLERVQNGEDRNAALRSAIRRRDLALADGRCGERVCEALWKALNEEDLPHM